MTPPDPQQVAEIAGRLSKAQRRELMTAPSSCREFFAPVQKLADLKLIKHKRHGLATWHFDATPLGLAVRNFIQGTHHD